MKRILITSVVLLAAICTKGQTLFNIGKDAVSVAEFMANYKKNNANTQAAKTTMAENLELYIRYKLKVKYAYDTKMDTLQNQREELIGFKQQIAGKYLTEDKKMKELAKEAFDRSQKDIRIAHITVLATGNDTSAAYKRITEAYKKLQANTPFDAVARQYSDDTSAATNGGDLGFVTTFALPYILETAAYNTPKGKYSNIVKSNVGYHIIKKTDERAAVGKMNGMQILLQIFPNDKGEAEAKARDIYKQLKDGAEFENLARTFSNDIQSAPRGGLLQEFETGRFDPVFEEHFVKLKDGDISEPFRTAFGWHIIKKISNKPPSKTFDINTELELISRINADARKEIADQAFLQSIQKVIKYKPNASINNEELLAQTNLKLEGKEIIGAALIENKLLHSFENQKVTVGNFWQFAKDARSTEKYRATPTDKLLQEYIKVTAFEYYKNNLEKYNKEFKNQIQDFKDGNLLFEAMEQNVWNKSANDEEGLKKYYAANKAKYLWGKSADAVLFNTINYTDAKAIQDSLQKGMSWKDVVSKFANTAMADSGRMELGSIPVADKTNFTEGLITEPFSPNNDGNYVFAHILKIYPEGAQRNFEDAKGLVINDYQVVLEDKWIADLKRRYKVKVNQAVWNKIKK